MKIVHVIPSFRKVHDYFMKATNNALDTSEVVTFGHQNLEI